MPAHPETKAAAVFGPDMRREACGDEWSFWDPWFCVVCPLDHGGDWAGLDDADTELNGATT